MKCFDKWLTKLNLLRGKIDNKIDLEQVVFHLYQT